MKRLAAASIMSLAVLLGVLAPGLADARHPHPTHPPHPSATASVAPTPVPTPTASPTPSPTATPQPSSTYLFDDEFDGTLAKWSHNYHCCMNGGLLDPSLSTVSGGYLHLSVVNRSGTWYGTIVDTENSFVHTYGYYAARIAIPKGPGLWPAFWEYLNGYDEIDNVEICANPLGTNGGNDASGDHTTVHYGQGLQVGSTTHAFGDLSLTWHTYAVDWRASGLTFYLDGVQVWSETAHPVTSSKAILLDLGLGGSWCGSPTSATPTSSTMLVDWVRVSP